MRGLRLIVVKTPKDIIEDAEEAGALARASFAVRDTEKGYFVTGYTYQRLVLSIDVLGHFRCFFMSLFDKDPGRALRLLDHMRGKRIGKFPWRHRVQVKEDVKDLVAFLRKGGYTTEIKD